MMFTSKWKVATLALAAALCIVPDAHGQQPIQGKGDDGAQQRARRAGGFGHGHEQGYVKPGNENQVHR